jgi:Ca2+/Na+ antiporter
MMPSREQKIQKISSIKVEVMILLLGNIFTLLSWFYSVHVNDASWFGRSGAILVFCCAVVEARNYGAEIKILSAFKKAANYINGASMEWEVPTKRKRLEFVTVICALLGTVIWGYGDLVPTEI